MLNDLIIFGGLLEDPVIRAYQMNDQKAALRYLVVFAEGNGISGNVFRQYAVYKLAFDDNIFSRTVEMHGRCGKSLRSLAEEDIGAIVRFVYKFEGFTKDYTPTCPANTASKSRFYGSMANIAEAFSGGPELVLQALADHYRDFGRTIAAKYIALGWEKGLFGIEKFDPITLDSLIGIDMQKEALNSNTERFLRGKGAQNTLLFGDSGTGKSSSVKALVNRYHSEGLRLLELKKHQLNELEAVMEKLIGSRYRYIVFLDDLSFEDNELGYKPLKAALEGRASEIPENVLIYATSNRRHLIKETWRDRAVEDEDVHISDTVQEKLSLAERFGLLVSFSVPGQAQYIEIVKALCAKQEIAYTEETEKAALQWAMFHHGRSGRTAKQFVNSLR